MHHPTNKQTERSLRVALEKHGFSFGPSRKRGENGPDIIATKGAEKYFIEVIGFEEHDPARSRDFYEVFFRAVSRLDDGARHCVMALPKRMKEGLDDRVRRYRAAWKRIGTAFPELEIWLVDTETNDYEATTWSSWLAKA